MNGKTIQIYLPDGDPKSVKQATITTDKIEIIQIPRVILSKNKNLLNFNGIYILVDSLKSEKPEIYIGKGNVKSRVSSHDKNKDFWNVVLGIKLDDNIGFNDAHTSYLECYFIDKANRIGMSITKENKQIPLFPNLAKPVISDLNHYTNTIEVLLSTLGLKCFQEKEFQGKSIFECKDKYGNFGEGEYLENGFMIYKGAKCKLDLHSGTKSFALRSDLIKKGILKKSDSHYVLSEDKIFNSVSTASSIILGRRSNGWEEWKDKKGNSLDKLFR